jgi:ABC-2 type transport system permease protein
MGIVIAFLRRDFLIWSSYRLALIWQLLALFALIAFVFFIGRTLENQTDLFQGETGTYVAFVLSGLAFTDVLAQSLNSLPQAIRENQKVGTLEPMLLTPVTIISLVLSSSLYKLLASVVRMLLLLGFGAIVLNMWHEANLISALLVFIPAIVSYIGIGTLSAAFIVVVKQGDPVLMTYGALTLLLSGMLFPIDVLPSWVQPIAALFPLTHALTGLRAALAGASPVEVVGHAALLGAMALVFLPLGIVVFNKAVKYAKENGSLAQY